MKLKLIFLLAFCFLGCAANAQLHQLYDNTNYKALYLNEASKLINTTPGLLLLDVRSPGEYADTSSSVTLNIGHLKGAKNISIDSIEKHLSELEPYKNKPILVYCSHSQRSRMVSKFLGDHGFTKVNSLNGGMSLVNKSTNAEFVVKTKLHTTHLPYKLIEADDARQFVANKNNLVIDVRPADQFNGKDTISDNNIGHIKGAINIPLADLDTKMPRLLKNKKRAILFYGLNGQDGVTAAAAFAANGYKQAYALFEGLATFMPNTPLLNRPKYFVTTTNYKTIDAREAIILVKSEPGLIIADVRPKQEFDNKSKMTFQNLGHVVNAVNYTMPAFTAYMAGKPKNMPLLVYGSNMQGTNDVKHDAARVCKELADKGYTNVYFLYNNLYNLVWSVTNVQNCRNGMSILTDHKDLY